jgi:hypothetical protein
LKKPVFAPGTAEDLVSRLGVDENDPRAMRIAEISEMKRLGMASKEEKQEWETGVGQAVGELIIESHARATNKQQPARQSSVRTLLTLHGNTK